MNNPKIYFPEIDILKGFAILFVIIGHAPQLCGEVNPVFLFTIHEPQMIMFFIASGFLFSTSDNWYTFLRKKIVRLLVPYLFFWGLLVLIHAILGHYTASGSYSVEYVLLGIITGNKFWFLWILMWIMIIVRLFNFRFGLPLLVVLSVIISLLYIDVLPLNIGRFIYYPSAFILGIYIRENYLIVRKWFLDFRFVLLCLLIIIFYMSYITHSIADSDIYISRYSGAFIFILISIIMSKYKNYLAVSLLSHFGKFSLQYYLNHMLVMTFVVNFVDKIIGDMSCPNLQWLINTIIAIIFSFIGLKILNLTRITRWLCGLKY